MAGHPRARQADAQRRSQRCVVMASPGEMGNPPLAAGRGRAAQPGALPALLSPSWTLSQALQGEKKPGGNLMVPLRHLRPPQPVLAVSPSLPSSSLLCDVLISASRSDFKVVSKYFPLHRAN